MSLGSGRRWPKKDASLVGEIDHGNSISTNKLVETCLNLISYSCVQQSWGGHYLCDRLLSTTTLGKSSFLLGELFERRTGEHDMTAACRLHQLVTPRTNSV
jgi:hypothetical protein